SLPAAEGGATPVPEPEPQPAQVGDTTRSHEPSEPPVRAREDPAASPTTAEAELEPGSQAQVPGDASGDGPGRDSHPPGPPHPSSRHEAPVEMLPPISGGAPDSASPEAESGVSPPPDSPSASESVSGAVLGGVGQAGGEEGPSPHSEQSPAAPGPAAT